MPVLPSYRNQSIDLHRKSINWFLYDGNIGIKLVNMISITLPAWKVSEYGVYLIRIFVYSDWIRIFSPNTGKYGPEKLPKHL